MGELKLETRTYRSNEELLDRWILDALETEETDRAGLPEAGHSIQKLMGRKTDLRKIA